MIVERREVRHLDPPPRDIPSIWVALATATRDGNATSRDREQAGGQLARMVLEASETRTVRAPR